MKEPWFWRDRSIAAKTVGAIMTPLAMLYDAGQRLRRALTRARSAGAPVICVGGASIGGAGKTPFAIMLCRKLRQRGVVAHFATRGFGGALAGPVRVNAAHEAKDVGDEALLLAVAAPTFVAKNRLYGVRAAASGADFVIMDDGFQNPTVKKDFSILLINQSDMEDSARVFPAGRLREPLARAVARADAVIISGDGAIEAGGKPVFRASVRIIDPPAPRRALAFCGVANPARFFSSLEKAGMTLVDRLAFADHHPYSPADIAMLKKRAATENAALITTEKDFVRLPREARGDVMALKIETALDNADDLVGVIMKQFGKAA